MDLAVEEYSSESDDEEIYQGEYDKNGQRHGRGTLYLNSQKTDSFQGKFVNDAKEGKGCFYFADGSSLGGVFKNDMLQGEGVYTFQDGSYMVGTYIDGELNGPAQEYDDQGRLTFKGNYKNNRRIGVCHFYDEFGGKVFGKVNSEGRLTGKNIVYSFPDHQTFIKGLFSDGECVIGHYATYIGIGDVENPFSYKKLSGEVVERDVSTECTISRHPMQACLYESKRVFVKQSLIADGGEGLFSKIKAPPGEVMSFYNGVRLTHEVVDGRDWVHNDNTISLDEKTVIDVPSPFNNTGYYVATLGHKANHSFKPNCKYDRFDHPRFDAIKCIRTIHSVMEGDELTVAYGYDHNKLDTDAPQWYREKLERHLENEQ